MPLWPSSIMTSSGANGEIMNKLKMIAGVLLILLTGIAAGHLGTVFYFQNKIVTQGPPGLHHLIKKKITRNLRLTDAQQIKFDNIIKQTAEGFDIFRQKHHPEVELILTDCFAKINEILTPKQQKRFEKIKTRFKRGFRGPRKAHSERHRFRERSFSMPERLKADKTLSEESTNY